MKQNLYGMSILSLNGTCMLCNVPSYRENLFLCSVKILKIAKKLFIHKIEMSYTGIRRLPMLCCLLNKKNMNTFFENLFIETKREKNCQNK